MNTEVIVLKIKYFFVIRKICWHTLVAGIFLSFVGFIFVIFKIFEISF